LYMGSPDGGATMPHRGDVPPNTELCGNGSNRRPQRLRDRC